MRLIPWLFAALALAVAVLTFQRAEQAKGALAVQLDSAEARERRAVAQARRLDTVLVTQTRTLTRWRDSTVTLRESLTVTDTVEVVRFVAVQDSTIAACQAVVRTCGERLDAERAVTASVRDQLRFTQRMVGAPRTAAGISYDRDGFGVTLDRDLSRFRLGGTITPHGGALRALLWW